MTTVILDRSMRLSTPIKLSVVRFTRCRQAPERNAATAFVEQPAHARRRVQRQVMISGRQMGTVDQQSGAVQHAALTVNDALGTTGTAGSPDNEGGCL